MQKRLTVSEFAAKFGLSQEYVRQMCRGYEDKKRNKQPYQLPDGWRAEQIGRDWIISSVPKHAELAADFECLDLPALLEVIQDLHLTIGAAPARASINIEITMSQKGSTLKARGRGIQSRSQFRANLLNELDSLKAIWRLQIETAEKKLSSALRSKNEAVDSKLEICVSCGEYLAPERGPAQIYCNVRCRKRHYIWIAAQANCPNKFIRETRINKKSTKIRRRLMG